MSSEKQRLVLFIALTFLSMMGIQYLMDALGLIPPPPKNPAGPDVPTVQAAPGKDAESPDRMPNGMDVFAATKAPAPAVAEAHVTRPEVALVDASSLVLGSSSDRAPGGYRLAVHLDQRGAGVASLESSRFEAERAEGARPHQPLQLLREDRKAPPSLALYLLTPRARAAADEDGLAPSEPEIPLGEILWEVVPDDRGRLVRPLHGTPPGARAPVEGQEVVFRKDVKDLGVTLTKTYRLWKDQDGFEVGLEFASPSADRTLAYKLLGPHGMPIEGEWYTGTFRDAFFGQLDGKKVKVVTRSAADVAKGKENPEEFTALPIQFAGIENQYFAVFVAPETKPSEPRWDDKTVATEIHANAENSAKADIGVEITSKPFEVGPGRPPVRQTYRVFAGPKTFKALEAYGATDLASYRKSGRFGIPYAPEVAGIISPLLDHIYDFTTRVARTFGGRTGNYGIAIILLTLLVRMIMFPLGRKQAMSAKKMQDLQPLLKEIQEKYKDDKEKQTRETWALYKKYGVNPLGGCLPALIQLPIFVGLWQALNTSVHLRHASFLYIENLAAPDMLFRFPVELPIVGRYFNLLPFLVVALMLVQTKLFAPPATTPEAEMQQKMMKYMMVFMAFMFYKVPSGLGLYFITSSLWQISERLLLPKVTHTLPPASDDRNTPGGGKGGKGGPDGNGTPPKPPGKLAQFWEKVKDEAAKDPTVRNMGLGKDQDRDRGKGKPRARPGRRR